MYVCPKKYFVNNKINIANCKNEKYDTKEISSVETGCKSFFPKNTISEYFVAYKNGNDLTKEKKEKKGFFSYSPTNTEIAVVLVNEDEVVEVDDTKNTRVYVSVKRENIVDAGETIEDEYKFDVKNDKNEVIGDVIVIDNTEFGDLDLRTDRDKVFETLKQIVTQTFTNAVISVDYSFKIRGSNVIVVGRKSNRHYSDEFYVMVNGAKLNPKIDGEKLEPTIVDEIPAPIPGGKRRTYRKKQNKKSRTKKGRTKRRRS